VADEAFALFVRSMQHAILPNLMAPRTEVAAGGEEGYACSVFPGDDVVAVLASTLDGRMHEPGCHFLRVTRQALRSLDVSRFNEGMLDRFFRAGAESEKETQG